MNQDSNKTSLPSWFTESPSPSPVSTPTPAAPQTPKKRRTRLVVAILIVFALAGLVVGVMAYLNYQRNAAFTTFEQAYFDAQTAFTNFSSITEPDDLAASESPADAWKRYVAAIDTLKDTSIYKDYPQLIDGIAKQSLPYTSYAEQVMPAMMDYLTKCYNAGDTTMLNATCRAFVQKAINANDNLTKSFTTELLRVIEATAKDGVLTETATDAINSQLLKIFAAGVSIQDTVQPKVAELRHAMNLPALTSDSNE